MKYAALAPQLRTLLTHSDENTRRDYYDELPDATLADLLKGRSADAIWEILRLVPPHRRALVFGHLDLDHQVELTNSLSRDQLADLITNMSADERVDLFKRLPEEPREGVMPLLARAEREDIRKLSSYAEGTAGAIMTSDYVALTPSLTVAAALDKLRREWPGKETIYYAYVTDEARRLLGFVSLRKLILAKPHALVSEIMKTDVIHVRADELQETTAQIIAKHDLIALPVVNGGEALVGIVTHDDAMDVLTHEATEDILRMASTDSEEYSNSSILRSSRLRGPWLTVNLGTAMLSSFVVSRFQDTLSSYIILAAMMPIVAGLGGNAGTQTLAVTVRGIALGKISLKKSWRVILKEVGVGCLNGAAIGAIIGMIAYFWFGNPFLGLIMFLAMVTNLVIAGLFGSAIPLTLKALKLDPALGSSVFITAATDVGGFLVFLSLATMLLARLH